MQEGCHLLIINPWIYDFAAYDLWAKPMGLLYLSSMLRNAGFRVTFIDCLNPASLEIEPDQKLKPRKAFGTGKYNAQKVDKPLALKWVKKVYRRYGISLEAFGAAIDNMDRPDVVLVGSMMTYWYPGVMKAVSSIREKWAGIPVGLGGIYPTLCPEHARDNVIPDELFIGGDINRLWDWLSNMGFKAKQPPPKSFADWPVPAWGHYKRLDYGCIMTSIGCPFNCPYCASGLIVPSFEERPVEKILKELEYLNSLSLKDIAFYDDALLVNPDKRFIPLMEAICKKDWGMRFHTPNALHVRLMTRDVCMMLKRGGFKTIRMGVETTLEDKKDLYGEKSGLSDLRQAVDNLKTAGFQMENVGAYILCGLPDQTIADVEASILLLHETGIKIYLSEYSPICGTTLWDRACLSSSLPVSDEPLLQNNSLLSCWYGKYSIEDFAALKQMAKR